MPEKRMPKPESNSSPEQEPSNTELTIINSMIAAGFNSEKVTPEEAEFIKKYNKIDQQETNE